MQPSPDEQPSGRRRAWTVAYVGVLVVTALVIGALAQFTAWFSP